MRYILKANGKTDAKADTLHNILQVHNVRIVDGSLLPDMGLVDLEEEHLPKLREQLGDCWQLYPEKKYTIPDTRKKLKK